MESNSKKEAIAARLVLSRKQAGLSQGQVAKLLLLHRPSISEMEAGRRNVSVPELAQLSEIYGVDFEWLACIDTDKSDVVRDKVHLAARELSKLTQEDLDRVLDLLSALRVPEKGNEP